MLKQSNLAKRLIINALQEAGITTGDTILLHSDSSLVMKLSEVAWWEEALELLLDCFDVALTETGTLVVPTFNYDFCVGKPYDHERTPSRNGFFTNYIRCHSRSVRSFHPILSFAGLGARVNQICDGVSKSSYGTNSVYDRLFLLDAKIVFFNVSFKACSFIHHIEQQLNVDYRYLKYFSGRVSRGGRSYIDTFDLFVRDLDRNVESYVVPFGIQLEKDGLMKRVQLDEGYILQVRCKDLYSEVEKALRKDPYCLIRMSNRTHANNQIN